MLLRDRWEKQNKTKNKTNPKKEANEKWILEKQLHQRKGSWGLRKMDFRTRFTCHTLSLTENSNEVPEFSHLL